MSSTFEVVVRTLDSVILHPNADKLDLSRIGGYYAVVQKGEFHEGDEVLYIPEDALFTDLEIAKQLNCSGYLTGKEKNRVKAIRLRGCLSQGICIPMTVFRDFVFEREPNVTILTGKNWTDLLRIVKYEEPIPVNMEGKIRAWPSFVKGYDVDNIKRPESLKAMVPGEIVVATEKLHGTNLAVAWGPGLEENEKIFVCSSNRAIKYDENNLYWKAVIKYDLDTRLFVIRDVLQTDGIVVESLSIHGEIIGCQDLKYGATMGAPVFYPFDIRVNMHYLNYDRFLGLCKMAGLRPIPELYRGPYDYDAMVALSSGKTTIEDVDHIREGIVVKPVEERYDDIAGRVQFKFISEDYLLRKNATELH